MSEYYGLPYTGAEVASDLAKVNDKDSIVEDAPSDGVAYAQSNGEWAESSVDQLGTALDAIKGDETGDDLCGKLKEIVTSKLLIKKALIDADVENVGGVLSAYADMIKEALYIEFDGGNNEAIFYKPTSISRFSYMRFKNMNGAVIFKESIGSITSVDHVEFVDSTSCANVFRGQSNLTTVRNLNIKGITNARSMFYCCTSLTDISGLNTSNITNAGYMFYKCTSLTDISRLNTSNITDAECMFSGCTSLTEVGNISMPNATNMYEMFQYCTNLIEVSLKSPNVTNIGYMFSLCTSLKKLSLDVSSVINSGSVFDRCSALRYLLIKNVGKSSMTSWDFSGASNWGVESATVPLSSGARQSLIDSLITYSYDRATADMSACTITLSSTTMALLTDTEIAQITAKGFTLS